MHYDNFFLIVKVSYGLFATKSPIFYVGILLPYHRKPNFPQVAIILTSMMTRRQSLCLGKGARCNVLVKNLRPSREIKERILNPQPRQRVTDLIITRRAIITRGSSTFDAIFFTSATFPDLEIYAARKFTIVDAEGHPDRVWTTVLQADGTKAKPVATMKEQEIDPSIFSTRDSLEDIA